MAGLTAHDDHGERELTVPVGAQGGLLDLEQELGVAAGLAQLLHEQFERLLRLKGVQHAAELPDDLELVRREQDLFLTRGRGVHVDRGEEPLVGQLAAQPQLHVAGALELLEDDLVHAGPGLDEGRRQDGERAAVLDVARRAEEPLRRVERGRVDTTGQDAAASRRRLVVGAAEAGDGVEQHDHVVPHLNQPLGPLDGQLGDRSVGFGRVVEGRVDDLALDRALHVGDFLRPLVHEDDHEVALRVVLGDRVGDRLQDHRLAGLRRRDDKTALTLADRADQVDDPGGHVAGIGFEPEPVLRVKRHQLGELRPADGLLRVQPVDLVQPDQRVELLPALAVARLPDRTLDDIALAQAVLAHLGKRDVDVVRPGQVAGGADEGVSLSVEHVEDPGDRDENVVLADHHLRLGLAVAPAVPVAEPVAAAAAASVVVVLVPGRSAPSSYRLTAVALVPAAVVAAGLLAAGVVAAGLLTAAVVTATIVTATMVAAGLLTAALVAAATVAAATVAGGLVAAALLTGGLVTTATVAGGLLAAGLVAAALLAGGLVAAGLVATAGRLLVATDVPTAAVTALRFTRRGVTQGRVALRVHRGRGLHRGLRGRGLLGHGRRLLHRNLPPGRSLPGSPVRPVGRGLLVEAELLPGSFGADTAANGVTDAGRRACSDA